MAQNKIARLEKLVSTTPELGYGLNFVLVYEDNETRKWAREVFERVAKLGGDDSVRATWWKMSEMSAPVVLAGAVSTAMRADVIVIATRASEGLPLPFYFWVKEWLTHRVKGPGALVALLPITEGKAPNPGRVRDYLRGTAALGRLDFLVEERDLPAETSDNGGLKVNGSHATIESKPANGKRPATSPWKLKQGNFSRR